MYPYSQFPGQQPNPAQQPAPEYPAYPGVVSDPGVAGFAAPVAPVADFTPARRRTVSPVTIALAIAFVLALVCVGVLGFEMASKSKQANDLRAQATAEAKTRTDAEAKTRSDFDAKDFKKMYQQVLDINAAVDAAGRIWSGTTSGTSQSDTAFNTLMRKRDECVAITYRYLQASAGFSSSMFTQLNVPQIPDLTNEATNCRYNTI